MKSLALATVALALGATLAGQANAQARDQIRIVGSSTVFPFTTAVAETFARGGTFRAPIVESIGTGAGFQAFCRGVGPQHPDISNASRRITAAEVATCRQNGVTDIIELKIGFDGIVLAERRGAGSMPLTRAQIWRALAAEVPVNGQWVRNPYTTWNQVDPALPNRPIEVMGPPPTSGTRDSFNELIMDAGCARVPEIVAITAAAERRARCQRLREDGRFIEAGENDNLIVQRISAANSMALGIFGYSFLDQNRERLEGLPIDAVEANFENIASGRYPVARPLYIYLKRAHVGVIPGLREFMVAYASEQALGNRGYLVPRGLIPLPADQRAEQRRNVENMVNLILN